jgi:hypothetical protein
LGSQPSSRQDKENELELIVVMAHDPLVGLWDLHDKFMEMQRRNSQHSQVHSIILSGFSLWELEVSKCPKVFEQNLGDQTLSKLNLFKMLENSWRII